MRSVLAVLLALMMLVVFAACGEPKETTQPDTTEPDVTEPDVTTPEETEPEETDPEETDPEVTTPEETLPDETLPDETLPDETEPEETQPEVTTPEDTTKPADPNEPHKHVYYTTGGVATCTQDGTILYACACGDMYEEKGAPAYGHTWILLNTVQPATCTSAGVGDYRCAYCGWYDTHEIPMTPHNLSISALLVSQEDDKVSNKGFELLACADCSYMEKVMANHSSGHTFVKHEDDTITCRCGAVAEDSAKDTVLKHDFSDAEDNKLNFNAKIKDEKWWISGSESQNSMVVANIVPELTDILKGSYEGDSISAITYSFKLTYTGKVPATYGGGGAFFSWRSNPIKNPALNYNEEISLNLTKYGDNLLLECPAGGTSLELLADKEYVISVNLDPINDTIGMSIYEKSMTEPMILAKPYAAVEDLSELWAIFMSRKQFYYGGDDFAFYADDLDISYVARNVVAEGTVESCEHNFVAEPLVDEDHKLFEKWFRETCTECERYYDRQDCSRLEGHKWETTPISVTPATCTAEGVEIYQCIACGEQKQVVLEKAHGLLTFEGIVSAVNDPAGKGYELWACDCGLMQKVYGNNANGHLFVQQPSGNGLCRCGAVNDAELGLDESEMPEACEHEFVSERFSDYFHPAYEYWYRDTCSVCGNYMDRIGCEYTGHVWSAEPVDGDVGNCLTPSYAVFECLSCRELDVRNADKGPHSYTLFVSITPAADGAKGYETWKCDLCGDITTFEGNHETGHNFDAFTKKCICGATSEKLTAVRDEQQSADRVISKENSQPSFAVDSEAFSGTWEGEKVEYIRLSYKMCYTGDPRLSQGGKSTKYWMFSEWRFDKPGGYESVQLWLNLAGEKAKFGYDIEPEIKPNVVYTVWYELELATKTIKAYIGAEGEETLLLYTYKLKQQPTDSWRFYFSPNHVGYTPNPDDFSITISQIRLEAVEYVIDESNMITPTPVE